MPHLNRPLVFAGMLGLALTGAAVAGVVAHSAAAVTRISVTEREYHIGLSSRKAPAGVVVFKIKNNGKLSHELEIAGRGVKKKLGYIKPGKTATLRVTLKGGKYSIWCPVPGHAQLGMKTSINVPAVGGSTSTSTSTSGGGGGWG